LPYEEPVSKEQLVTYVEDEYQRRQKERQFYELQWQLNSNFIEGNQYCDVDPARMTIIENDKLYDWQEREVFNQIAPVVETRVARLSRMKPILKSRAATQSSKDIRSARINTQLLRNLFYEEGIKKKMSTVYGWTETTGTCVLKNLWNPDKGKIVARASIAEEKDDGTKETREEEIREGGLEAIVVPPHEIFPDSNFRPQISDCRSVIHARALHVDEIKEQWDIEVEPEPASSVKLEKSSSSGGVGGLGYGFGFYFTSSQLKDHAVIKEYWEKPSKKFPEGRLIITANKKLLHFGPLPFKVGKEGEPVIPMEKIVSIERPGVFWGRCVVDRLIPVQRRYNALRNRKAEFLNRCAIGQYVVEEGSTDLDELEQNVAKPGYMLVYQRGFNPPTQVPNPQLPQAFETEEAALLQEINVFSGVSELSKQSKAPPGVKSGVAMSIALEQDDTRLANTAANVEDFLVRNGQMWLRFHKKYVTGVHTLQEVGEDKVVEVLDWTGSDITSDDVIIEPFSALAESPAQRKQMVFDLLASGLFHDENGMIDETKKAKIFEMIELGNWEDANSETQLHIKRAERQNLKLAEGQEQPVPPYDDHLIHIQRHNKYRLTVEYEEMLKENPMIDMVFQQHVDQHLEFIIQTQMSQPPPEEAPEGQIEETEEPPGMGGF